VKGRLHNKVAVVTGGSRGIGRAICQVFAREGASVVVNFAANSERANALVAEVIQGGGNAIAIRADVASRAAVESMMGEAVKQFGPIDILINNAGILRSGSTLKWNETEFDRMMAVNLKGIINGVQAVAPAMIERRYGKIVNITSLAGLATAVAETTPYAITKAAAISLTKRLALELGPHGINVNAIAPGFVRTEMLQFLDDYDDRARLETLSKKAILNRIGTPEDIANAALFLASDESSFITAQVFTVDGGRMDFLSHSN